MAKSKLFMLLAGIVITLIGGYIIIASPSVTHELYYDEQGQPHLKSTIVDNWAGIGKSGRSISSPITSPGANQGFIGNDGLTYTSSMDNIEKLKDMHERMLDDWEINPTR